MMGSSDQPTIAWQMALVRADCTLLQVIRNLEQSGLQIALVVGEEGGLIGTITDGDVRRGLLRDLNMDSPIETAIQRSPLVAPPDLPRQTVLQIMQANKINQMPIVDEARRVVGLYVWDELIAPAQRPNMMLIMAGGKGQRLQPYTKDCPKPLLSVGGKAILEHIIERAKSEGFLHFVLAINYLGHMIEEYFGDGSRLGVNIDYLREDTPLGTAGAISLLKMRPEAPFVVSNGDVLTDIRYGELLQFHSRHGAAATMAVRLFEWQHPFGVVQTKGVEIVGFEEKPIVRSYVNAGVYVLEPATLATMTPGEHCDMPTLFERQQKQGFRTIVYPMHEPWLDIGRIEDLEGARIQQSANNQKSAT
jgi:dTDP-glucose pyrophosphorylase/predicted transcriptional regulator